MDKKSEKAIRKVLTGKCEEIKETVETALNTAGLEVLYIDCWLSMREGYYVSLNIKRGKVNKSINQKSIGDKHWQLPEEGDW